MTANDILTALTIGQLSRRFDVPPRVISDLFYARKLDAKRCPIVGGRRLVPESYVAELVRVLRAGGHLPIEAQAESVTSG
jgi:hypothetical protein